MAQETLATLDDYILEVGAIQDSKSSRKFYDAHMKKFKEFTKTLKEDDWEKILELILISLWKGSYISEIALTLLDKRKLFNLKKHPEIADRIFDNLRELGEVEYKDHAAINGPVNNGIGEKLITIIKAQKLLDRYIDKMCEVVMTALMTEKNYLTYVCFKIVAEIPFLSCPEWINKFFERIYEIVTTYVELSESADLSSLSDMVTMFIFQKLNISGGRVKIKGKYTDEKPTGNVNGVGLSKEFMDLLLRLFNFCKDQEFLDPDDSDHHTLQWVICKNIMEDFLYRVGLV